MEPTETKKPFFILVMERHWPFMMTVLPNTYLGFRKNRMDGITTHNDFNIDSYHCSDGGKLFLEDNNIPDDFFAAGVINGGGSEYLCIMWFRNNRCFWFYDQYANFMGNKQSSFELTAKRLEMVLLEWNNSSENAIYSGIHGWYEKTNQNFNYQDRMKFAK